MLPQGIQGKWLYFFTFLIVGLLAMTCSTSRDNPRLKNGKVNPRHAIPVTSKNPLNDFVFIKGGDFVMGVVEGVDTLTFHAPHRRKVASFYINKYEVTNYEYRKFINWVRDSLAHIELGHFLSPNDKGETWIDWSQPIDWALLEDSDLYYQGNDRFAGRAEINTYKLVYNDILIYPDTLAFINDFPYAYNEPLSRYYFYHPNYNNYPVVGVNYYMAMAYCDWLNKHILKNKYPPVRLPTEAEWEYAAIGLPPSKAKRIQRITERNIYPWVGTFYNPQKNGQDLSFNCNGGPLRDIDHDYMIHGYPEDGGMFTISVNKYKPNGFGLYQMAGNVGEWVEGYHSEGIKQGIEENLRLYESVVQTFEGLGKGESFWEKADQVVFESKLDSSAWTLKNALNFRGIYTLEQIDQLKPRFFTDSKDDKMVVKGGGYPDPAFYMQVGARKLVGCDSLYSYIGFRIAMSSVQTAYQPEKKIRNKKARKNQLKFIRRKRDIGRSKN